MGRKAKVEKLGWGEGSVRQRGDRWQVRYREDGVRKSASGFESRTEALEELGRIEARVRLGQPGTPESPASDQPRSTRGIPALVEDFWAGALTRRSPV